MKRKLLPLRESKKRIVSISLEEVAAKREGKLDVEGLKSTAFQIDRLLRKGFRIIVVVGGGSLGREYAEISKAFSKNTDDVRNKAAESNSLLVIAALRNLRIAVNSSPILDYSKVDGFILNTSWQVAVVANQSERRSSLVATDFAKKYHAVLFHIVNTRKLIDVGE